MGCCLFSSNVGHLGSGGLIDLSLYGLRIDKVGEISLYDSDFWKSFSDKDQSRLVIYKIVWAPNNIHLMTKHFLTFAAMDDLEDLQ